MWEWQKLQKMLSQQAKARNLEKILCSSLKSADYSS
jgi:hypothetical protein